MTMLRETLDVVPSTVMNESPWPAPVPQHQGLPIVRWWRRQDWFTRVGCALVAILVAYTLAIFVAAAATSWWTSL